MRPCRPRAVRRQARPTWCPRTVTEADGGRRGWTMAPVTTGQWWPGAQPDHPDDAPVIRAPATSVTIASLVARFRLALAWLLVAHLDGFAAGPSRDEVTNAAFARQVVVGEIILFGRTGLTDEVVEANAVVWVPGSIGRGPS